MPEWKCLNGSVAGLASSGAQLQCFRAVWQFCFCLHVYNCPGNHVRVHPYTKKKTTKKT